MATASIEERLTALETELDRLKLRIEPDPAPTEPWWAKWMGAFENDPYFDEAMRLGAEYRRSQPLACDEAEE